MYAIVRGNVEHVIVINKSILILKVYDRFHINNIQDYIQDPFNYPKAQKLEINSLYMIKAQEWCDTE